MSVESKFDSILHRGIPFLLFSPNQFRLKLSQKIEALYHLYQSNDETDFYALYQSIIDMLDNKEWFGTGRESDIKMFTDDYKSFNERIIAHDKIIIDMENHIKKIDNNRLLINKHYRELKRYSAYWRWTEDEVLIEKELKGENKEKLTMEAKHPLCMFCNHPLVTAGYNREGRRRWRCKECKKWYQEDDKGIYRKGGMNLPKKYITDSEKKIE